MHALWAVTLVLAFASLCYELLLAQMLATLFGSTLLRYSVTIGVYVFSLGLGSLLAGSTPPSRLFSRLFRVELLLTAFGGLSPSLCVALEMLLPQSLWAFAFGHACIVGIGILSGFELPLLIQIAEKRPKQSANRVLGWDYVGSLLAAALFPTLLLPKLGIFGVAWGVACLNLGVALLLPALRREEGRPLRSRVRWLSAAGAFAVLVLALGVYPLWDEFHQRVTQAHFTGARH